MQIVNNLLASLQSVNMLVSINIQITVVFYPRSVQVVSL